jgi:hypothetical protein
MLGRDIGIGLHTKSTISQVLMSSVWGLGVGRGSFEFSRAQTSLAIFRISIDNKLPSPNIDSAVHPVVSKDGGLQTLVEGWMDEYLLRS